MGSNESKSDTGKVERLKEREHRRVEKERHRPRRLWQRDPGIDSPQDYE